MKNKDDIFIYTTRDLDRIKRACEIASETLDMVSELIEPGISTLFLDEACHNFMIKNKATPATLGYRGYPKSCCISLNHVVCHGIPNEKKLKNGDILNIDVTCIVDGWFGDTSRMFAVGDVSLKAKRLIGITYDSLLVGIDHAVPGNTFGDIGAAIQIFVEKNNMSVVRDFCGHGIGNQFHQPPNVLHYGSPGTGPILQPGMCFTIEPMVNIGRPETKILADNWTAVTRDKTLSAQFEHTIFITNDGSEVLTGSKENKFFCF